MTQWPICHSKLRKIDFLSPQKLHTLKVAGNSCSLMLVGSSEHCAKHRVLPVTCVKIGVVKTHCACNDIGKLCIYCRTNKHRCWPEIDLLAPSALETNQDLRLKFHFAKQCSLAWSVGSLEDEAMELSPPFRKNLFNRQCVWSFRPHIMNYFLVFFVNFFELDFKLWISTLSSDRKNRHSRNFE